MRHNSQQVETSVAGYHSPRDVPYLTSACLAVCYCRVIPKLVLVSLVTQMLQSALRAALQEGLPSTSVPS